MFRPLAIIVTAAALALPAQAAAHADHTSAVRTPAGTAIVTDNKDPDRLTFLPEIDDTVLVERDMAQPDMS